MSFRGTSRWGTDLISATPSDTFPSLATYRHPLLRPAYPRASSLHVPRPVRGNFFSVEFFERDSKLSRVCRLFLPLISEDVNGGPGGSLNRIVRHEFLRQPATLALQFRDVLFSRYCSMLVMRIVIRRYRCNLIGRADAYWSIDFYGEAKKVGSTEWWKLLLLAINTGERSSHSKKRNHRGMLVHRWRHVCFFVFIHHDLA